MFHASFKLRLFFSLALSGSSSLVKSAVMPEHKPLTWLQITLGVVGFLAFILFLGWAMAKVGARP